MSEIRVVRHKELQTHTAQTPGMTRYPGIAGNTVGSKNIWVGYVVTEPDMRSGAHHHGDCESAIYLIRGHIRVRFGERLEKSVEAGPGDFIYVPPRVIHQEITVGEREPAEAIVVRDSQENVVVDADLPEAVVQER